MGIQAVSEIVLKRDTLRGVRIAVQGLGATGYALCKHLYTAGEEITVADVRDDAVARVLQDFDATAVDPNDIHSVDVDVFAPCALGAGLNDETIPRIQAKAICGLAYNQLAEDRHGAALRDAGIAYVPDYVVNAGGMMGASQVIYSEPSRDEALKKIESLKSTIQDILQIAMRDNRPTSDVANDMALQSIEGA